MVAPTKSMNRHPSTEKPVVLLRQLGIVSATALVISNMIGTGIFTTSGFLAADLGDPKLILLIWVVGAVFALFGAFSYSELGVNFPSSGGEYVYLTRAYGPTWGFMTGVGVVLRRLLRSHSGRRAGVLRLHGLFLPRPEASQRAIHARLRHVGAEDRRRADARFGADHPVHSFELLRR